jgi:gliding motility-associated-like protein
LYRYRYFELEIERPDCGAQLTEVRIDASGGTGPYKYSVDGIMATDNSPAVAAGLHTFLVTDANGCTADAQTNVDIPGAIVLTLPTDTLVELGQSLTITAQTNLNVWDQLNWSPRVDTTCNNCLTQTWTPLVTQVVTITLVDTSGCAAKASILVKVDRGTKLYVPSVFSPDGDGFNDFWTISAGISVKTLDLVRIFDRWGTQLYEWNDPVDPNTWTGWDGNYRGDKAPPAVYVYYMWVTLANGEKELKKGDLTILR